MELVSYSKWLFQMSPNKKENSYALLSGGHIIIQCPNIRLISLICFPEYNYLNREIQCFHLLPPFLFSSKLNVLIPLQQEIGPEM